MSRFYLAEGFDPGAEAGSAGLLARLVGDLVAHLDWQIEGNQARITHVYVLKAIRGKRVGRALIQEAVAIARTKRLTRIVVPADCPAREFFLRTGFAEHVDELFMEVS